MMKIVRLSAVIVVSILGNVYTFHHTPPTLRARGKGSSKLMASGLNNRKLSDSLYQPPPIMQYDELWETEEDDEYEDDDGEEDGNEDEEFDDTINVIQISAIEKATNTRENIESIESLVDYIFEDGPNDSVLKTSVKNAVFSFSSLAMAFMAIFTIAFYSFPGSFRNLPVTGQYINRQQFASGYSTNDLEYSESGGVQWFDFETPQPKFPVTVNPGLKVDQINVDDNYVPAILDDI